MLKINRNMHLCLLSVFPVLTGAVTWELGAAGDSCSTVCSSLGGCKQNELNKLDNYPGAWSQAIGGKATIITARNYKPYIYNPRESAAAFGTPYVHEHSLRDGGGPCYYPTLSSGVAACTQTPSNHHRRLCPCDTPACSNTNGQNTQTCKCGTSTSSCSPYQFCESAKNLCHTMCRNHNLQNTQTCKCGTATCSRDQYCSADHVCYNACPNTDGDHPNGPAACQCGTSICSSSNGFFCKSSSSTCFKTCSHTNGQRVNPEYCKCHTKECTSVTGLYCKIRTLSSSPSTTRTSNCYKKCTYHDGLTINSGTCKCGTSICSSSNGLFCKRSSNTCFKACADHDTDGSTQNSGTCKCGTSTCSSSNGLFCKSSSSTCFKSCTRKNGLRINSGTCKCGASTCEPNSLCNGNLCSPCVPCGNGTKQINSECCVACEPGRYSNSTNSSTCHACQPGFFAAQKKAGTCRSCGIGTYAAKNGSTTCTVCAPGSYQNASGSTKCKLCPVGKTLTTASTAEYHDELFDCEDCGVLYFNPFEGHAEACYLCLTAKKEGSSQCDGCDPGKFKVTIVSSDGNKTDECKNCESGYFSIKQNVKECSACPMGYFANHQESSDGEIRYDRCQACPRGLYGIASKANNTSEGCGKCTSGTYSDETGISDANKCKGCPKGKWSARFGVTKESACVYCGTGKYGLIKGAKDDRVCIDCSVGKYLDSVGASRSRNCQNCPIGFVQPEEGAAYCLECIPGKFSASEGLASCLDCSTGQFKSSGQTQCQDCPSGYDSDTSAASVCNKCPAGKAGRGCKRCTVGQYRSADDQVLACKLCSIGFASKTNGSAGCRRCAAGKFAAAEGSKECTDCTSGRYRGNEDVDSSACIDCKFGEFSSEKGQPFCLACDAGTFSHQHGSTKCQVCPTGFAQSEKRAITCDQCDLGKFASENRTTSCSNCDKGKITAVKGESSCEPCPSGKITAVKGESSCKTCPSGSVASMGTSCVDPPYTVAENCLPNEYLNDQSSDRMSHTCMLCPVGGACGQKCPKNAGSACPKANNISLSNIYPLPTYWRVPHEYGPGKDLFSRCPFPKDCQYEFKNGTTCASGTTGDLCSRCMVGYDRISSKCTPCVENEILFRCILLLVLILLVFVGIYRSRRVLKKLHHKYAGAARDTLLAVKIVISFLQINLSMPSMMSSFQFPELYILFLNRMSIVNVDMASVLGVQCVVNVDFRFTMLVATLLPLFVLLVCAAVYIINSRRIRVEHYTEKQRAMAIGKLFDYGDFDGSGNLDEAEFYTILKTAAKHHKFYKHESNALMALIGSNTTRINVGSNSVNIKIINRDLFVHGLQTEKAQKYINIDDLILWVKRTSLFSSICSACSLLLMVLHAPVSAKAFYYFDCHRLGAHKSLLRRDYSLVCWEDRHQAFIPLAVLLLLFFAFLFPAALAFILVRARHHLHSPLTRSRIGWLYPRFVLGAEWWDIHEILRKMILCGVLVFFPEELRPVVAILISLISVAILNYFQPHKSKLVFWIAQASFGLTTLKYLIVVFGMLRPLSNRGEEVLSGLLIFLDVLLILLCVACVFGIFFLLRGTIQQITSTKQQQQLPLHFPHTASAKVPVPSTRWTLSQHHIARALADANARKTTEMAEIAVAHAKAKIAVAQEKSSKRLQKRLQNRLTRKMTGTPTPPLSVSVRPTMPAAAKVHAPSKQHRQLLEKVQGKLSGKIKTLAVLTTIFTKLDVDHSGGISKEEFAALIQAVLKNTPKSAMVDMLWDMAWDGNTPKKMEMDINILGSWLGIVEINKTITGPGQ